MVFLCYPNPEFLYEVFFAIHISKVLLMEERMRRKGVIWMAPLVFCFITMSFLMPLGCFGYVQGDTNGDGQIGLPESIFALRVAAGEAMPLSGTVLNVPGDFSTIQQAINAAGKGDTIQIAAGTYNEILTVDGKSFALSGNGSGSTIIRGATTGGTVSVITIDHNSRIAVSNLTVQNGAKGIYVTNNSDTEINQVVVENCGVRGVEVDTNSHARITNSTMANNEGDGIGAGRNANVTLSSNISLTDNGRCGLFLILGSTGYLDSATLTSSSNEHSGICLDYNSTIGVEKSAVTMTDNGVNGLRVSGSSSIGFDSDSTVTIDESGEAGVGIYSSSRLYSDGTMVVSNSTLNGVEVEGSSDLYLNGPLTINTATGVGLFINRTSAAKIAKRLEITNVAGEGLGVSRSSSFLTVDTANVIVSNTSIDGIGIDIGDNSTLRAQGGTFEIKDNTGAGIDVGRNSSLDLRNRGAGLNVTINGNQGHGILLYQQGSLRNDANCIISGNAGDGLYMDGSSEASLRGISIQDNTGWGINVRDGASINIAASSTIQGNQGGAGDISLQFGARSTIYNSSIGTVLSCDSTVLSSGNTTCP